MSTSNVMKLEHPERSQRVQELAEAKRRLEDRTQRYDAINAKAQQIRDRIAKAKGAAARAEEAKQAYADAITAEIDGKIHANDLKEAERVFTVAMGEAVRQASEVAALETALAKLDGDLLVEIKAILPLAESVQAASYAVGVEDVEARMEEYFAALEEAAHRFAQLCAAAKLATPLSNIEAGRPRLLFDDQGFATWRFETPFLLRLKSMEEHLCPVVSRNHVSRELPSAWERFKELGIDVPEPAVAPDAVRPWPPLPGSGLR